MSWHIHNEFIKKNKLDFAKIINQNGLIFDLKGIVKRA